MNEQCNTCGSLEDIQKCQHCPTVICLRCQMRHEEFCEQLQKMKQRGQGPTVRQVLSKPEPSLVLPASNGVSDLDAGLAAVRELLSE